MLNNLAQQYGDQAAVVSVYSSSGSPPFFNNTANQKIHRYPPPYWYNHSWYFATPWLWVDGSKRPAYLTNTWQTYINNRLQVDSDLDIQLLGNYNPQTNILDLQISISNTGMDTIRGRLHGALTENGIVWHAPNGQQVHNHVPRIWWPDADGLPVSIPPGDTEIQFANWNISSTWNADSLWIMAFVQDNVMQPDTTIEIFQGATLKMADIITAIDRDENDIARGFQLYQNYPNPFNPGTTIAFDVPLSAGARGGLVTLKIYDPLGKEVKSLVNKPGAPGHYEVQWDGTNKAGNPVGSGVYVYRLKVGRFMQSRKLLLLR